MAHLAKAVTAMGDTLQNHSFWLHLSHCTSGVILMSKVWLVTWASPRRFHCGSSFQYWGDPTCTIRLMQSSLGDNRVSLSPHHVKWFTVYAYGILRFGDSYCACVLWAKHVTHLRLAARGDSTICLQWYNKAHCKSLTWTLPVWQSQAEKGLRRCLCHPEVIPIVPIGQPHRT